MEMVAEINQDFGLMMIDPYPSRPFCQNELPHRKRKGYPGIFSFRRKRWGIYHKRLNGKSPIARQPTAKQGFSVFLNDYFSPLLFNKGSSDGSCPLNFLYCFIPSSSPDSAKQFLRKLAANSGLKRLPDCLK